MAGDRKRGLVAGLRQCRGGSNVRAASFENRGDRLIQTYLAERQDDQYALVVAFAIVTVAITYISAATAFISSHCSPGPDCTGLQPCWILDLAPLIPVSLSGFLVLNVLGSRLRSAHLQRLERELAIRIRGGYAPSFHTAAGLVFRPDQRDFIRDDGTWGRLTPYPRVGRLFAVITYISYVIIYGVVAGFIYIALLPGPWGGVKILVAIVYGLFATAQAAALILSMKHPSFGVGDEL